MRTDDNQNSRENPPHGKDAERSVRPAKDMAPSYAAQIADIGKGGLGATVQEVSEIEQEKQRRAAASQSDLRLFWISVALTVPLLVDMILRSAESPAFMFPRWLQFVLATPVQFWAGKRFYLGAWQALRSGSANMDVLVALGTSMAYVLSVVVTVLGLSHQHVYFEVSAGVITLILMGRLLEERAKSRTIADIEALYRLQPKTARIDVAGVISEVPVEQVKVGDRVVIRPGETAAIGGKVLEGRSNVDESMLTGESRPVQKRPGDQVYAGTLNLHGQLVCEAMRIGKETVLSQIIRLVNRAQGSKVSIQRLADKVSSVFVPVVLGISIATFALWWGLAGDLTQALINAVAVLVIACPAALSLAAPTAAMVGIGQGAKNGIFVRTAAALERAAKIQVIVFDKSGILTDGKPVMTDIVGIAGKDPYDLIYLAAALAKVSSHPFANAIIERAKSDGIDIARLAHFTERPGEGIEAQLHDEAETAGGSPAWLGTPEYLRSWAFVVEQRRIEPFLNAGKTVLCVADREGIAGYLAIIDPLRLTAAVAVSRLKEMGVDVVMLSAEDIATLRPIATNAGITNYRTRVLPEHRADVVRVARAAGKVVGMIGDGTVDARALAAADVSIAVGAGANVQIETADMTLMKGDLASVADAISLSRATLRKIRQNIFFAFIYNSLAIPLAAFGILNPVIAGAGMAVGSLSVVGNSLLLKRWKPGRH